MIGKTSSVPLALCAAVAALVPGMLAPPATTAALPQTQPKPKVTRIEEPLFLMYALEDMSRKTPADLTANGPIEAPTIALARFAAQQRLLFDILRRYVEKKQKGDYLDTFRSYEKKLDVVEECAKSLEKSCAQIHLRLAIGTNAASSRVMMSGLSYGLRAVAEGDDLGTGLLRGMTAMAGSYIDEQKKINELRFQAAQELQTILQAAEKEYAP
ncbi:MAG TPA: hypothetical protein VE988_10245, partial [Gemmataceae bacterium]|nr:hypothetical protein [Gemmataceae bacterium]